MEEVDTLRRRLGVRPLLVGEDNPHGSDPKFALWPSPPGCAGDRLCRSILQMTLRQYVRAFDRTNLCHKTWSWPVAREAATKIKAERTGPLILLGAKVCEAFELSFQPFTSQMSIFGPIREIVILPHPSGRSRAWNAPGSGEAARQLVLRLIQKLTEEVKS